MATTVHIHSGMNWDDAWDAARILGCHIILKQRTGQVVISHPRLQRPVVMNGRRKDASRALTVFLKKVIRVMGRDTV